MQVAVVIHVSSTISLTERRNMWFNIIFWCCARFNDLQRYSHSNVWSHNFKAAYIDGIVTLEW